VIGTAFIERIRVIEPVGLVDTDTGSGVLGVERSGTQFTDHRRASFPMM